MREAAWVDSVILPKVDNNMTLIRRRFTAVFHILLVFLIIQALSPLYAEEAILPFHQIKPGTVVNLEFDIIGKYVAKYLRGLKLQN